jgi:hypothetical protein
MAGAPAARHGAWNPHQPSRRPRCRAV